jgi:hypothetical protein
MAYASTLGGRKPYAGSQPTPEEAKVLLNTYNGYFGPFDIDGKAEIVIHHLQGVVNPGIAQTRAGTDAPRPFEVSGNRLALKPAGGGGYTFERVPELPQLRPPQRRLLGFWTLVPNVGLTSKGETGSLNSVGVLVFTASGHTMLHIMQQVPRNFAAAQPTDDEVLRALRTYDSWFGTYAVDEARGDVALHHEGDLDPRRIGTDTKWHYEFSRNRLILKANPVSKNADQLPKVTTWERWGRHRE